MTETAKAVIDRLQYEAGYATGGEVDKLVYSGLDVHTMLNEIEQAIDTDENKVEKLRERLNTAKKALTESKELLRDMNRECDGLSEPEETLYNIIRQALAAIGDKLC